MQVTCHNFKASDKKMTAICNYVLPEVKLQGRCTEMK